MPATIDAAKAAHTAGVDHATKAAVARAARIAKAERAAGAARIARAERAARAAAARRAAVVKRASGGRQGGPSAQRGGLAQQLPRPPLGRSGHARGPRLVRAVRLPGLAVEKESGWKHRASNPSSGAYGIPQALPGGKMASAGADWRTNPITQISWGLSYIKATYGTPCGAWAHSQASAGTSPHRGRAGGTCEGAAGPSWSAPGHRADVEEIVERRLVDLAARDEPEVDDRLPDRHACATACLATLAAFSYPMTRLSGVTIDGDDSASRSARSRFGVPGPVHPTDGQPRARRRQLSGIRRRATRALSAPHACCRTADC